MSHSRPSRRRWLLPIVAGAAVVSCGLVMYAQGRAGAQAPTTPVNMSDDPMLKPFTFRSIGPATMMGRLDDIQGAPSDPMIMYIGFATGGLWKSTDGGNHWKSLWDNQPDESIGSIAISATDPNVVYVGSGEANNRQSSSVGDGVWGTRDGGATWTHLGLDKTQSIARVQVDPTNPNVVWVAAVGDLFGPSRDRGLYKSTDGGANWKLVKYIDENTGFTDVEIDPSHPDTVYAASYERRRTWWGFNGGGPNSGLWKTTDGGNTFTRLDGQGWPKPKDGLYGRIALAVYPKNPQIIYAQVEAGASAGTGGGTAANGGPEQPGGRGANVEAGAGGAESAGGAGNNGCPVVAGEGGGGGGGGGGRGGRGAPPDPNGSGVFRSDDGGQTWTFMSNQDQRPTYFSRIRVDPDDANKLLVGGTPGQISTDGGKCWTPIRASHTDYHALWFNPKDPRIIAVGHDGGLDFSYDGGDTWAFRAQMAVGQFYQVSADMRHPYWVCGGLQDNNAWCGPSALRSNTGPTNDDWFTVAGGDGFYTRQDPTDWHIIYAESQDGNMSRTNLRDGSSESIRPNAGGRGRGGPAAPEAGGAAAPAAGGTALAGSTAAQGAAGGAGGFGGRGGRSNIINAPPDLPALRFYWNAPFEISPEDPSTVYMAAQYFFKSTDRGDSWWMNPEDLTKNVNRWAPEQSIMGVAGNLPMVEKHDGYSASSLATQVRESPSRPGVIWIGTDDGNLQVSTDDGVTFTNVIGNIGGAPKGYVQVSRIEPSHFDPGTAYVALDNHRNDDWKPYLFKTTNFGRTWVTLTNNLPTMGPIQGLREDVQNPNLLFVGTEFGLFISTNGGQTWSKFMNNLPEVPVDDILIHPRDRDLILATHGRSIWIADDITPLEQLNQAANKDVYLFDPRPAVQWKNDRQDYRYGGDNPAENTKFYGQNPQGGTAIDVYAKSDMGPAKIEFLQNNQVVSRIDGPNQSETVDIKTGINRFQWNMQRLPAPGQNAAAGRGRGGFGGGRGGRGGVPFVSGGRGGGGGFGGAGGGMLEPGVYTVRLTIGDRTLESSVVIEEDVWMSPAQ